MALQKALLAFLLAACFAGSSLLAIGAAAEGSASDPDMEDSAGDQVTSARPARDLVSGWATNETETTIELNLKMTQLEPFTPFEDWQSLPVEYYEFFFDVVTPQGLKSYEARATIPIHLPAASLAQYELFLVTYGGGGSILNETTQGSPQGRYLFNDGIISFTVDKVQIGEPARGDVLQGIWARTRSASQRTMGDSIVEDTMLSHLTPGKPTTFSGGITFYAITFTGPTSLGANATTDEPARFTLTIHSDSEKVANISLRNSSAMPSNWTMVTDKQIYVIDPGQDVQALVTITPAVNQTNTTRRITVGATFRDDQNETRSSENTVTLSVTVPPLPGGGGGGGGGGGDGAGGDFGQYLVPVAVGVVAVGALVFVFGFFLPNRRLTKAREAHDRMVQMKMGSGPRSGAPRPQLAGRTGMPPRPGGASGAPVPGMPPRPGAAPRPGMPPRPGSGPRPVRPIPKRR